MLFDYVFEKLVIDKNLLMDYILEDNGWEENNNNDKNKDLMYYVLEGFYLEGVDENG